MAVAAIVAISGYGRAEEPVVVSSSGPVRPPLTATGATIVHPNVNCTCRFGGSDFQIGDTACIRGTIATCATFLNNTSWAMSKTPCPVAKYSPTEYPRAEYSPVPRRALPG